MTKNHIKTLVFTIFILLRYITIKKIHDCENISSVNPLYLRITHANGYIEEKNGNRYLIFDSTDENKVLLIKCNDVFNGIKNEIKENDYEKDYMKIKFNSDENLPSNKPLKFHLMTNYHFCFWRSC